VILAKQIATLQYLSSGRFILGAGVGWYGPEFEACGTTKRVRGARTDEVLRIVDGLLSQPSFSFDGKHFQIEDVSIEPLAPARLPIWVGGGSQLVDPQSPEKPHFAETVKARIARYDGWIARPTAPVDQIAADLCELRGYLEGAGRDPSTVTMAHENFVHLVDTNDHDRAVAEQRAAFERVMSEERSFDYLKQVYLMGTPEEIVEKLWARANAGIEYFILHTLTPDPAQLDLWARYILPEFATV
jgi:alkanesulfonate monooxygenase SsuD/methylene tetrahydromethanopterin reductase-like flavin-dependent oxidoreductase (luciferase family)